MNGPNFAELDPYVTLGVAPDADFEVLKSAYRRLVRENHPDIARDKMAATNRTAHINAAWSLVGDPIKRAAFDARRRLEAREKAERLMRQRVSASRPAASKPAASNHSSKNAPRAKNAVKSAPRAAAPPKRKGAPAKKAGSQRLEQAMRLLQTRGNPNDAIELCRSVIRSDFRSVQARELMGEAFLRLGELERASAVWEQALILQPDNPILHRRWRELRANLGKDSQPSGPQNSANSSAHAMSDRIPTIHAVVRPLPQQRPSLWKRLGASLRRK